ncbi:MAG TPA: ATP-binding protein [Candidatus Acidoferrum sp.]|nr:ATP-binding protein [Candidatus Acidoferrum sp.]
MKPEIIFGLESAAWPAMLVNASCVVLRANAAATTTFSAALVGDAPSLSLIWAPANGVSPEEFFARWEQSPKIVTALKLRVTGGTILKFNAVVSSFSREGGKWYVLQLLPELTPAGVPPPVPAAVPEPAAPGPASETSGLILKQKLDCALQLARTVSLDFNNALTIILGHTSLLLSKAEPTHPWRHSLLEVEKSASRAAEVANELTMFSRQEKEPHRAAEGNLNLVVNGCVDFFRNEKTAKITWKPQLERELFSARFDEAKVQQAVTKLLENAVEAIGDREGQIFVQTRNVELAEPTQDRNVRLAAGTYVCLEIGDSGPGIAAEVLPRIFEPFFTTKGSSHRGLGLALVYGIVTNHGGGVAVSSQPGAGTSVRVYLPAEKQLVAQGPGTDADLNGSETILVVDDEGLLLTMAETILTDYGYVVLTANSGQQALDILSGEHVQIDLIITDLVMPAMGGRELIERVRQLMPGTRILCTSGYAHPADKQADTPYLQKPFTSRELLAKVKQVLTPTPAVD